MYKLIFCFGDFSGLIHSWYETYILIIVFYQFLKLIKTYFLYLDVIEWQTIISLKYVHNKNNLRTDT